MLVKALTSFAGKISMYAGEVREIEKGEILDDLLAAKYVEAAGEKPGENSAPTPKKPVEKKKKK